MPNTLTNLIPDLYESLDVVSRELTGFIPSVTYDPGISRAAVGEVVRSHVVPAGAAADIVPDRLPPDTGDQTIGNEPITISKARAYPFRWTGEEQKGLNNGAGYRSIRNNQIKQAMRTLVNEIEADLAALYARSSRAYGTAGTTPFATDLSDPAQIRKILSDNGAPLSDLQLVIDTSAGAKLRTLGQLTKANEAGTVDLLEQGVLLDIHNFKIRESGQVRNVVKGTGSGYLVNNGAGYAVGATTIAVDTGTGTIVAGDVITFAGDPNKYVVATTLAAGSLVIAAPGLRQAVADNVAVTVGNNYVANLAFSRSAIILSTRAPALPEEGDSAIDRMMIADERTGLAFEISMYAEYRRIRYECALAWGVANIKPAHTATLLG